MEIYKRETDEITGRFLARKLTLEECLVALYDALTGVLTQVGPDDLPAVRAIIKANEVTIRQEMQRRLGGGRVVNWVKEPLF